MTIRPAFNTPLRLSPTFNPDLTSVPDRSARPGFADAAVAGVVQRNTDVTSAGSDRQLIREAAEVVDQQRALKLLKGEYV